MFHQYLYVAITMFWVCDYASSFHKEWKFLRQSRWTKVKVLYITARYLPFLLLAMYLYLNFSPENPDKCKILINTYSCFTQLSLTCSESFFVLRTRALWHNNRIVLVGMMSTAFALVVTSVGIRFTIIATTYVTTSAIPGVPGCSWSSSSILYFMLFIFLFVFQLGLVSLTLIRVIQSWRSAKGNMHAALVKHNIFYYVCGLILSAVNVVMPLLFPDTAYYIILEDFQVCVLRIIATRMHLHLWHLDQHMHNSEALVNISMSDMSPVDSTV
ncbi:hypothetical protein DFJ58DRAFT_272514 [Suillus subalutaceus]|uniref:uncharacterized protein n=1 Tax=Suillus subalutaceus TaxID=48586 RepID=UPI001B886409|nr:uncharacterized protein DFJ58DRAFT_272514 [Suillus subalutaceus]KAG1830292.1 hypothetical protein DFJ58DRAFT_272514 [Suillus subalutaceus]